MLPCAADFGLIKVWFYEVTRPNGGVWVFSQSFIG